MHTPVYGCCFVYLLKNESFSELGQIRQLTLETETSFTLKNHILVAYMSLYTGA